MIYSMIKFLIKIYKKYMFKVIVNGFVEGGMLTVFLCIFMVPRFHATIEQKIIASLFCVAVGILFLFCNISIRRFDRKYLKQILEHAEDAQYLILFTFFFSLKDCLRIRFTRGLMIYFKKYKKGSKLEALRKKILPEYSRSEIRIIDRVLLFSPFILIVIGTILTYYWHVNFS